MQPHAEWSDMHAIITLALWGQCTQNRRADGAEDHRQKQLNGLRVEAAAPQSSSR